MVTEAEALRIVGSVSDPHLPISIADMGMVEGVILDDDGGLTVRLNIPCHHCPGFQLLRDSIAQALRAAGFRSDVRVAFEGSEGWRVQDVSSSALRVMRAAGIQVHFPDTGRSQP